MTDAASPAAIPYRAGDDADSLAALAASLKRHYRYVSARDELTDPKSAINSAADDEPVFVLRARDMVAAPTIDWWLWCAKNRGVPESKLARAERQLTVMEMWVEKKIPSPPADPTVPIVRTAQMERTDPASILNSAHPDEPVFAIVASDVVATEVVEFWAYMARQQGAARAKVDSAMEVAKAMALFKPKRVVGLAPRETEAAPRMPLAPAVDLPVPVTRAGKSRRGWSHAAVSHLYCLKCGHEEVIGEPPYTPDLLKAIAEACAGPCPACGAEPERDPDNGLLIRPLTTKMAAGKS